MPAVRGRGDRLAHRRVEGVAACDRSVVVERDGRDVHVAIPDAQLTAGATFKRRASVPPRRRHRKTSAARDARVRTRNCPERREIVRALLQTPSVTAAPCATTADRVCGAGRATQAGEPGPTSQDIT